MASIIETLGAGFWRFRLGIGNERLRDTDSAQFVLDNFSKTEATQLPKIISVAAQHVKDCLAGPDALTPTSMTLF